MEKPPSGRERLPYDNDSGACRKLLKKKKKNTPERFKIFCFARVARSSFSRVRNATLTK